MPRNTDASQPLDFDELVHLQDYALVRSDVDTLLLPLLKLVYEATQRAPSDMYMLLVILLILSQDPALAAAVHLVP